MKYACFGKGFLRKETNEKYRYFEAEIYDEIIAWVVAMKLRGITIERVRENSFNGEIVWHKGENK